MCVLISTEVSPLLNFFSSTLDGFWPRRSQMCWTSCGWELPEKMQQPRMLAVVESSRVEERMGEGVTTADAMWEVETTSREACHGREQAAWGVVEIHMLQACRKLPVNFCPDVRSNGRDPTPIAEHLPSRDSGSGE